MSTIINLGRVTMLTSVPDGKGSSVIVANVENNDNRIIEIEFQEPAFLCIRLEDKNDNSRFN